MGRTTGSTKAMMLQETEVLLKSAEFCPRAMALRGWYYLEATTTHDAICTVGLNTTLCAVCMHGIYDVNTVNSHNRSHLSASKRQAGS